MGQRYTKVTEREGYFCGGGGEVAMGICWYCHWGWSKEVAAIHDRACEEIDALDVQNGGECVLEDGGFSALHFGPGHIVWEDENFAEHSVRYCLENFELYTPEWFIPEVSAIVRRSLEELLALPEAVRDPEPDDYDDEHPERFPPAVETTQERHDW